MDSFRIERDSLGEKEVPLEAYYGIQTVRAIENFPISGIKTHPDFIWATVCIKKAAAISNMEDGALKREIGTAIITACDEIIAGKLIEQFVVDVYQAGAGTSHHMNANEVIANRANEILGFKKGNYSKIHPNDHVNMCQSTNDVFPTAMRLAVLKSIQKLLASLYLLEDAFEKKAKEFKDVVKSARTHLQDAVPTTLGNEFSGYSYIIADSILRIKGSLKSLHYVGIGGTAAGTGVNASKGYSKDIIMQINKIIGSEGIELYRCDNLFGSMQSMADFTAVSSSLKNLSIELIKISNDIRLMSSGPTTGLSEIDLPPVQPGSSIMPGKVNPVIPEMLAMCCFQVIGNDLAISMAAQAGQLDLNVMMPLINYNMLNSISLLGNAISVFVTKCLTGITANKEICRGYFEKSIGIATILNPYIGYTNAAKIALEAYKTKRSVIELIVEKGIMSRQQIEDIINDSL